MIRAAQGFLTCCQSKELCGFESDRVGRRFLPRISLGTRNKNSSTLPQYSLSFCVLSLASWVSTLGQVLYGRSWCSLPIQQNSQSPGLNTGILWPLVQIPAQTRAYSAILSKSVNLPEVQFLLIYSVGLRMSFLPRKSQHLIGKHLFI